MRRQIDATMGLFRKKERNYEVSPEIAQGRDEIDAYRAKLRQQMGGGDTNPFLKEREEEENSDHPPDSKGRGGPDRARQAEAEALMSQQGFNPYAATSDVEKPYQCDDCGTRYQDRWGRCNKCGGKIVKLEEQADVASLRQQQQQSMGNVRQMATSEQIPQQQVPEFAREAQQPAATRQVTSQSSSFACSSCGKEYREKWGRSPCCGSSMEQSGAAPAAPPAPAAPAPLPAAPATQSFAPGDDDPLAGLLDTSPGEAVGGDALGDFPVLDDLAPTGGDTPPPATHIAEPAFESPPDEAPDEVFPDEEEYDEEEGNEEEDGEEEDENEGAPGIRQAGDGLMDFGGGSYTPKRAVKRAVKRTVKRKVKRAVKRPVQRPRQ